jgi:hypothetical protein
MRDEREGTKHSRIGDQARRPFAADNDRLLHRGTVYPVKAEFSGLVL